MPSVTCVERVVSREDAQTLSFNCLCLKSPAPLTRATCDKPENRFLGSLEPGDKHAAEPGQTRADADAGRLDPTGALGRR